MSGRRQQLANAWEREAQKKKKNTGSEFAQHGALNKPVKVMHPVVITEITGLKAPFFQQIRKKTMGQFHTCDAAPRGTGDWREGRSNSSDAVVDWQRGGAHCHHPRVTFNTESRGRLSLPHQCHFWMRASSIWGPFFFSSALLII